MLQKYKIFLSYEGTRYNGWQVQPNGVTVQGLLQQALHKITQEKVVVVGSGRTDSGVHAVEQVAHFTTRAVKTESQLLFSLNGLLPHDIRVLSVEKADPSFHARFSAKRKIYIYHIHLHPVLSPFQYPYLLHLRRPLDTALVEKAAKYFLGTHDFCTFANKNPAVTATHKTLYRLDVIKKEGGLSLEFEGNGFLYKMVRNIVGTLLEVGLNKRPLASIPLLLQGKDRRLAGKAAPAKGLFLKQVVY